MSAAEESEPSDAGVPGAPCGDQLVLFQEMYEQLRAMARSQLADERCGHSLQATALVHEAWLRLRNRPPSDSAGFLQAAARAMRQALIDHARSKGRVKRGRDFQRLSLDAVELVGTGRLGELLAIDEALVRLAQMDPSAADCVRLRFYAGLSVEETARVLGISERSAYREWAYAKAYLFRLLGAEQPSGAGGSPDRNLSP